MRIALALCLLVLAALPALAQPVGYTKPSDIPISAFFRHAEYAQMALSPDGKRLAALRPIHNRENLVVIDFQSGKTQVITGYKDADVIDFTWVSNDRLYFRSADQQEASGERRLKGAYAIDIDGQYLRDLNFPLENTAARNARRNSVQVQQVNVSFRILSRTFDGSGDVIAEIFGRNVSYADVYRFNTKTGQHSLLTVTNPGNVVRWVLDRDLVPRIAVRLEERVEATQAREQTIWHRADANQPWEKIGVAAGRGQAGVIHPLAFDYDNKTLYVAASVGQDRKAIYKYDIGARKLGEQLLAHPLIDLEGGLIFSRSKKALVGIRYSADLPTTTWFDDDMAKLQAGLDKALPNSVNAIDLAADDSQFVLIHSASDVNAGSYFLYHVDKRKLQEIAKTREWLPPALMSRRSFITYKARDGRVIPAWVTTPINSDGKNLPLVVHIHGGPWVRAYHGVQWGRWPTAQFLASRGYLVLEPEPRGSTGFGRQHYTSSFKQWGLTMQDDITDGAQHLVSEGIADKSRMCLFGASYGGYASLQGLVKDPDLWRCAVSYVAVTDLELKQTVSWSDAARGGDYIQTDMKRLVGDKDADREQFLKTSPAQNADKIKAAVLLAMGELDTRVPIIHGTTMKAAMDKAGRPIEYVTYRGEGHGFNKDENVHDFYTRVEGFLATHLKK